MTDETLEQPSELEGSQSTTGIAPAAPPPPPAPPATPPPAAPVLGKIGRVGKYGFIGDLGTNHPTGMARPCVPAEEKK